MKALPLFSPRVLIKEKNWDTSYQRHINDINLTNFFFPLTNLNQARALTVTYRYIDHTITQNIKFTLKKYVLCKYLANFFRLFASDSFDSWDSEPT